MPEGDEVMGEGRKMKERGAGGGGDKRIIDVGKGRSKKENQCMDNGNASAKIVHLLMEERWIANIVGRNKENGREERRE